MNFNQNLLFSERYKMSNEVKQWLVLKGVPINPFNIIVALDHLGYLKGTEEDKEEIEVTPFPLYKEDDPEHMYDKEFLQFIHDRLKNVHNENPNVNYMLKLRSIIEETYVTKYTSSTAKCFKGEGNEQETIFPSI